MDRALPRRPAAESCVIGGVNLLGEILSTYKLYLSEETRLDHLKRLLHYWLRRVLVTFISYLVVIGIMSVLFVRTHGVSLDSLYRILGYIGFLLVLHVMRRWIDGLTLGVVVISTAFLATALWAQRVEAMSEYESSLDILAFGACVIIGLYAAERKYPYTVGDLLGISLWNKLQFIYGRTITTTSIVGVFTYGAFQLAKYTFTKVDLDSSLLLIPLVIMAIVAVVEFVIRESTHD